MKIESNVLSIMREMLTEPEKDWKDHLPFIQITEEDFSKGEALMRKHIKNASTLEYALERFENYKETHQKIDLNNYFLHAGNNYNFGFSIPFLQFLKDYCSKKKGDKKRAEIHREIEEVFEYKRFDTYQEIFDPFYLMFNALSRREMFNNFFLQNKKKVEESFDWNKASEVLKEEN